MSPAGRERDHPARIATTERASKGSEAGGRETHRERFPYATWALLGRTCQADVVSTQHALPGRNTTARRYPPGAIVRPYWRLARELLHLGWAPLLASTGGARPKTVPDRSRRMDETERADHRAAAAIHRAAAIAHRTTPHDGAGWRSREALEWSRNAESHCPMGGKGPGHGHARTAVSQAKTAEEHHAERHDDQAVEHHQAAAGEHDRAAAEHDVVAAEGDTALCDICERDTPADELQVGLGDSTICRACCAKERRAWARLIDWIAGAPSDSPVDEAVRDLLVARLRKEHKLD